MRVAIVSDTHSYLAPDVMAIVETCDIAVHAGDIGGKEILDLLRSRIGNVIAVRGNNDVQDFRADHEADVVNTLPRIAELELPGGKLVVEHGHRHGMSSPEHEKLRQAHPQAKLVVYGHTHKRVIDRSATPWVVNPGAAGKTRNDGGPSCLVLHASQGWWDIEAFKF
jgi:uncharacterized protein